MAKSTKKKEEVKEEVSVTSNTVFESEESLPIVNPAPSSGVGEIKELKDSQGVQLNVSEVREDSKTEEIKAPDPIKVEPIKPTYRKELDRSLSFEERIESFLEGKYGTIKLNDFLKSLYPLPKFNEPPVWLQQGEMKRLRVILDNMQSHGRIKIVNNIHSRLGTFYYEGEQQFARHYNLNTITVEVTM